MRKIMKLFFSLVLSIILILLVSACNTNPSGEALTSTPVINYFAQEGMPIGNVIIYTEETDSNNLLGRPGGYTSKVNFEDERTLSEYVDTASLDYYPKNTLEIFDSERDARARFDYIESVTKGTVLVQYMYLEGTMLLRLERSLLPTDTKAYETLLQSVVSNYRSALTAPEVTRRIENYRDLGKLASDAQTTAPENTNESGFEETETQTYSYHGVDFSFPLYYETRSGRTNGDVYFYCVPNWIDTPTFLMFSSETYSATLSEFYHAIPQIIDNILNRSDAQGLLKSEQVIIAGMSGWSLNFTTFSDDLTVLNITMSFFYNIDTEEIIYVSMMHQSNDRIYDYATDYQKILESATLSS